MFKLDRNPIKREFSADDLKIIAIVTMLIDHIGAFILENLMIILDSETVTYKIVDISDQIFRSIGRLAFPIFCFFIASGYFYTRNKWKYLSRLLIFAAISEIPFDIANSGQIFYSGYQSVYFTLAMGLLAIIGRSYFRQKNYKGTIYELLKNLSFFLFGFVAWFTFMSSAISSLLLMEKKAAFFSVYTVFGKIITSFNSLYYIIGLIAGFVSLVVFTMLTKSKAKEAVYKEAISWYVPYLCIIANQLMRADYGAKGILLIVVTFACIEMKRGNVDAMFSGVVAISIFNPGELCALINVIFIDRYKGKKGKMNKYFFYAFYPVHLLILGLIAKYLILS